jgi:hypothetical protein
MQVLCETLSDKTITLGVESSDIKLDKAKGSIPPGPDQQPAAKEHEVDMADDDDWMDDVAAITVPTLPQV